MAEEAWTPGESAPADPERPNLLAALSVLLGGLGFLSYCGCYFSAIAAPIGLFGVILAGMARRQAGETGYGTDYAWWGLVLGTLHLVAGMGAGLLAALAVWS